MSDDYGKFNPDNPSHQEILDEVKEYMQIHGPRVSEQKLAWLLCSTDQVPWGRIENHDRIHRSDILEDYRTEYSPKYLRNVFTGLRQYLQEQDFLTVEEEKRGGRPAIIYQLTGESQ